MIEKLRLKISVFLLFLSSCGGSIPQPDLQRRLTRCPDVCEHVSAVCDNTSYDSCVNDCRVRANTDEPYDLGCAMTSDTVLEMRKCGFRCREQ
jgi:hypothetical protein